MRPAKAPGRCGLKIQLAQHLESTRNDLEQPWQVGPGGTAFKSAPNRTKSQSSVESRSG